MGETRNHWSAARGGKGVACGRFQMPGLGRRVFRHGRRRPEAGRGEAVPDVGSAPGGEAEAAFFPAAGSDGVGKQGRRSLSLKGESHVEKVCV